MTKKVKSYTLIVRIKYAQHLSLRAKLSEAWNLIKSSIASGFSPILKIKIQKGFSQNLILNFG